ncbi:alpha/beta fold hydrolase [Mycolicibacterium sp.]|uniref:alpha/beta fold hydrolase n=1 Tax=Mycolicibacterium sp. TaxID=2320850 RepID=UPI003D0F2444
MSIDQRARPGPPPEATAAGRFIDVGPGKLYAHVRDGDGPTLVFLHYWGGSHRTWTPVIRHLGTRRPIVGYDQRGWGASNTVPGPYHLDQLADDTLRVVAACALDSFVLVGHSMGGKVAQLVAARRPPGLRGLVLVAPAPPSPVDVGPAQQEALVHAYDSAETVGQSIDAVLTRHGLDPVLRDQVVEDSLRGAFGARTSWPRDGLVRDITAAAAAIDVPALVLAGDEDRVESPQTLTRHLLPHLGTATMRVLAGTGHLSPLEVPEQVATAVEVFVAGLGRRQEEDR